MPFRAQRLLPQADQPTLAHFYSSTVDVLGDLRLFMYRLLSRRFINVDPALNLISTTNWDLAVLGTSTSPYVGLLIKEFETFADRWAKNPEFYIITPDIQALLWKFGIQNCMEMLVEGYSRAKKVRNAFLLFCFLFFVFASF